ncbi:MAG: exonuclease domain-containing protein [Pseudomonadota bacterium]|nr:exonuclease domain-containing protein [Pseudomonadota bacterium]MDP1905183.1 exonuclease domain-containing protein [Pseudomonadota bacterium]MDP2352955.1 exonuclease domain-containing protein [Pseudomonadota bacterium]
MSSETTLPSRLVFIDLETTGANPLIDRITEIGLIEVVDGETTRWTTLVNPQRTIPAFIQHLTGIRDEMVANAPTFDQVAEELRTRLHGKLFIAHNVRFDYGFVKNEFKRLGQRFQSDVLCTVRLSRKLHPEHHKHNLDSLIARHGLHADDRHRALADAELIWQFWQQIRVNHPEEVLLTALQLQLKRPALPPHLDPAVLDDLPEAPGVYLIYGEGDLCLYAGKSINLRQRVFAHFAAEVGNSGREHKEMNLSRQARRLDWHETVGEVGALLLESRLVKQLKPLHNRRLHEHPEICAWRLEEVETGDFRPRLVFAEDVDMGADDDLYGPFNSKREATNTLRKIAEAYKLCPILLGLEKPNKTPRPCSRCRAVPKRELRPLGGQRSVGAVNLAFQVGQCKGACVDKEPRDLHSARLMSALAKMKVKPWPWPGPVGLIERDDFRDVEDVHVLNGWRYLGTAHNEAEIHELLEQSAGVPFDLDIYKLLKTHLGKGKLKVRVL